MTTGGSLAVPIVFSTFLDVILVSVGEMILVVAVVVELLSRVASVEIVVVSKVLSSFAC